MDEKGSYDLFKEQYIFIIKNNMKTVPCGREIPSAVSDRRAG